MQNKRNLDVPDIVWRLACLASLPFQERYVIGGGLEGYVLDVELLENVDGLKFRLDRPENRDVVTPEQGKALSDLFDYIAANSDRALAADSPEQGAQLIREGEVWRTLRAKASDVLRLFGISAAELTVEQIDQMSGG